MGVGGRRGWRRERDELVEAMLGEFAALGYDHLVEWFVVPDSSQYREVTGPSGRTYTLLAQAWWEDEEARTVHLSVMANRGAGLRFTGSGGWRLLEPPELS